MFRTLLIFSMLIPLLAVAEEVNVSNFVRAESDHMLRTNKESRFPAPACGGRRLRSTAS